MMNKKGISPLIATVLVIGFTVALAAVIITWGQGFIKDTTENVDIQTQAQLKCTNVDFGIISATEVGGIKVESKSDQAISGFRVLTMNANGLTISSTAVTIVLDPFSVVTFNTFTAPFTLVGASSVKLIPVINGDITCGEAAKTTGVTVN